MPFLRWVEMWARTCAGFGSGFGVAAGGDLDLRFLAGRRSLRVASAHFCARDCSDLHGLGGAPTAGSGCLPRPLMSPVGQPHLFLMPGNRTAPSGIGRRRLKPPVWALIGSLIHRRLVAPFQGESGGGCGRDGRGLVLVRMTISHGSAIGDAAVTRRLPDQ